MESRKVIEGKDGLFAEIKTNKGIIIVELFYKAAPLTVTNFVGLSEGTLDAAEGKKFYNGLIFHRVIKDFMIQGGDPEGSGRGGPGYQFPDEPVEELIFDEPGKLAMANAGPGTNGSQFFITHVPTPWLNYKHTIFGKVVTGQDVVDSIQGNDTIVNIEIIRNGAEAEAFTATQEDFNKLVPHAQKQSESFISPVLKKMVSDFSKTDNGIYYKVISEGNGAEVKNGNKVVVEYKGYSVDGNIFDGSTKFVPESHDPIDFVVGAGQMIRGFEQMVLDMKVGETRTIVIPPELGYGRRGIPQVGISGTDYICFDVYIVSAE
ncbi:peptidylprolyl isomerase [Treponema sp.]|uniref:peptidylprolyl isomerase n=1 Tax=Treponema sp. TaxID=166 RepID=UPI00298D80F3|nr:peptidylprolyl isomerase [Treponema sp.]